jgi:membrane protease YdiL (CAAX protease family)
MQERRTGAIVRLPMALVLGLVISFVSLKIRHLFPITESSPEWLGAFITHSFMCVISILIIIILTKGKPAEYGFSKGSFRLNGRILLWVIPMAILSVAGFFALRSGAAGKPGLEFNPLQTVIFVWIYASAAEEIFTRGLLQGYLSPLGRYGINLSKRLRLSLPVLFSGLYFGLMHIVAIDKMGPPVILLTTFLGIVAGYYREKTGSLMPAIIIHALFNIGGTLPMWILSWLL